jgi:zinc transport system substrate-binding protein
LDSIDLSIRTALNQKTNKTLLVYHPAWTYFANEFGMEQISIEHDGKEPKAKELKNIIQMAKEKGVKCIFFDPHFDESSVETIARSLGLKIESLDPLPLNYLENLKEIRDKLNRHLE